MSPFGGRVSIAFVVVLLLVIPHGRDSARLGRRRPNRCPRVSQPYSGLPSVSHGPRECYEGKNFCVALR